MFGRTGAENQWDYTHWLMATKLSKNAGSLNLSLAPFKACKIFVFLKDGYIG